MHARGHARGGWGCGGSRGGRMRPRELYGGWRAEGAGGISRERGGGEGGIGVGIG